jgi:RNA polymerase sigma-70 factor (ECF subfamily)
MSGFTETTILSRIKQGDKSAFSFIFNLYYADLVNFAFNFTKDRDTSEEIVQDIFVRFWENRHSLTINSSLKSFLLRSVQNRCIDWIRHLDIQDRYRSAILINPLLTENDTDNYILYSELHSALEQALDLLPEEITKTFRMNRYDGLTYQEIADKLGISIRSVEVRIGKALQLLREKLKDYLIPILIMLNLLHATGF